jgi:hypothetical protein
MTKANDTNPTVSARGDGAEPADSGRGAEAGYAPLAIVRLLLLAAVLGLSSPPSLPSSSRSWYTVCRTCCGVSCPTQPGGRNHLGGTCWPYPPWVV